LSLEEVLPFHTGPSESELIIEVQVLEDSHQQIIMQLVDIDPIGLGKWW